MEQLELPDIQGLVIRGYGTLKAACYVLLAIENAAAAKPWLGTLAAALTSGQDQPKEDSLNVAFTAGGLRKLGLADSALAMFANEFLDGMADPGRARILGDSGANAPEHWRWGGPTTPAVDVLLLLYARDASGLAALYAAHQARFAGAGLAEVATLETVDLGGKEHFGFRDGVSQPIIPGLSRTGSAADTVQAGEFILGYANEYGRYTSRPLLKPA